MALDNVNRERIGQRNVAPCVGNNAANIFRTLDLSGRSDINNTICDTVANQTTYRPFAPNIAI